MRTVAFMTVGCKLNQFETEQMRETAEARGYRVCAASDRADVYVVNTCTVTSKSDYRSRQAARRAVRINPDALVIVTGCYAQVAAREIADLGGIDVIIGNNEKADIGAYLGLAKQPTALIHTSDVAGTTELRGGRHLRTFGRYTRAFVKIQDGCDNRCSYCAVPLARGPSRSKRRHLVIEEVRILAGQGYKEVVLTGVHLGSYGRDLRPRASLADLLAAIAADTNLRRVRLSSVEPTDMSQDLIDLMADPSMRVCPHVHIPLQSGDDGVLMRMGRSYSAGGFRELLDRISLGIPQCAIGADVMVGFPGEDENAFRSTYNLLEAVPVTYLHVFSFSRRPGTRIAAAPGSVPPETKRARSRILRELGRRKNLEFRRSLIGKTLEVLLLGNRSGRMLTGLSGNYTRTYLDGPGSPNDLLVCRVCGLRENGVVALPTEPAETRK
jgi:threonylcarbamoyladenosine tRNA methylthiotransferase MtaB